MKVRFLYALMMAVALCAFTAGAALADDPIVFYDDTEVHRDFDGHEADGLSYVHNGAFDEWINGGPKYWKLDTSGITGKGHFAKMDLADPRHDPNYALGLFLKNDGSNAAGSAVAHSELNIPAEGDYWVVVHSTAWGENVSGEDAPAWYAIYPTQDPAAVPEEEWRELAPMWYGPCPNADESCLYLGRDEVRHLEPGSHIFLKGAIKFPKMHGWTVFGWDDIGIWNLEDGDYWPYDELGWLDDGDITWDRHATR